MKWQVVQKHRLDDTHVLVHTEWPHEPSGGNHKGEQNVCVVYTDPEEGWSTSLNWCAFWENNARERANREFNKRRKEVQDG